jgi:co-chaperonin GroES (HSP10)
MAINLNTLTGKLTPISNRVIVSDMYFGEQKTKGGIIINDDDGKTRGIYPRWGKVHSKGPDNEDPYEVGNWVLVEHGRWTRSIKIDEGDGEKELRMVEAESILAYSDEKPDGVSIGAEYADGEHATVDPSSFINPN